MSYNPNIPLNLDYMVVSQPQVQSNFQTIFSTFAENHVPLNSEAPPQGQHSEVVFYPQTDKPDTLADQVALYNKALGGGNVLYYRPQSNATEIQMNYPDVSTGLVSTDPDVWKTRQYTFVAGAFVVYMGKISGATDGQLIVLTPATTLIHVGLTLNLAFSFSVSNQASAINIAGNQFNVKVDSTLPNPFDFYYTAIGQP